MVAVMMGMENNTKTSSGIGVGAGRVAGMVGVQISIPMQLSLSDNEKRSYLATVLIRAPNTPPLALDSVLLMVC